MKMTIREQRQLIYRVGDIMLELSTILNNCDNKTTIQAAGRIIEYAGLILKRVNTTIIEKTDEEI